MQSVSKIGDVNTGGGAIVSSLQTGFKINSVPVSVNGSPVSAHPPCPTEPAHCAAVTSGGVATFKINGIPVNTNGNADTCGHTRIATINFTIS